MSRSFGNTWRRLAAVALGAVLATGIGFVPSASAAEAGADVAAKADAGLYWGVKKSWRGYVAGFRGSVLLDEGAVFDPDPVLTEPKPYRWPVVGSAYDPVTGKGTVAFGGKVNYSVPSHTIWDVGIAHPKVTFNGDGTGTLTATVNSSLFGTKEAPKDVLPPTELVFADLVFDGAPTRTGELLTASVKTASLTEAGAKIFGGTYQKGDELDAGKLVFWAPPAVLVPKVTVTPSTELDPDGGTEITIKGTGFDPAGNGGAGYGLRGGPELETLKDPGKENGYQLARLIKKGAVGVQIPLGDDGSWEFKTKLKAKYTGTDGNEHDAAKTPFRIYTFGWKSTETTWDTVTPLAFKGITVTPPEEPTEPPPGPEPCVLTPANATKGNLLWGLKKSFRRYVGIGIGTADGNSIRASDGAEITNADEVLVDGVPNSKGVPTGAYRFGLGSVTYGAPADFTVQYRGTVTFDYPSHFFTIRLANPKVVVQGGTGKLYADVELDAREGSGKEPVNRPGVALADLDLGPARVENAAGVLSVSGVKAKLTSADAFGGFYQAGDALDDVTVLIGADCSDLPAVGGAPATGGQAGAGENLVPAVNFRPSGLAATGATLAPLYTGLGLLSAGVALVLVARRRASAR
ncbi:HtaA domain-containing protein [Amycolatopsis nigrescens]|uniref:HtaA domain-containing protein n=1 Tax=Amycolatopsis nigrescens TaxID=381445 RepID=UPI00035C875C|nr:HtaA domain-containing protein [Amycolatopsis nigrescens]